MRRRGRVVALALGLAVLTASGRAAAEDEAQLWLGSGLSLLPAKKLELSLDPQVRFDQDISRVSSVLGDVGVLYGPWKWLRIGAGYRAEGKRENDDVFGARHRINADVEPRFSAWGFRFSYRLRLQEEWRLAKRDREVATFRNRLKIAYHGFEVWRPAVSAELFVDLGDFDRSQTEKLRLKADVTFPIGDHRLGGFYALELPLLEGGVRVHIIGLEYRYEFDLH